MPKSLWDFFLSKFLHHVQLSSSHFNIADSKNLSASSGSCSATTRIVRRKLRRACKIAHNYAGREVFISRRRGFFIAATRRDKNEWTSANAKRRWEKEEGREREISLEIISNKLTRLLCRSQCFLLVILFFFGINPSRDVVRHLMSSLGEHKRSDDLWSETPRWKTVAKQYNATQIRLR